MASKNGVGVESAVEDDARDQSSQKSGYECEFVKPPAKDFQSDCPVCLLVLREPHRVSCCGKAFCAECIGRLKKAKKRCPTCNANDFTSKLDKNLKSSLSYVCVHCSHQRVGCEWTGALGDLEDHLNLSPSSSDYKSEGCRFAAVACAHCRKCYQRHCIAEHESQNCPKRPYTCPTCHHKDTYTVIVTTHLFDCQKRAFDSRLKAVEQRKSSQQSLWFLIPIIAAVCAVGIVGLLNPETIVSDWNRCSASNDGSETQQLMGEKLLALEYSLVQNRRELSDAVAGVNAEVSGNRDRFMAQLDDALAKVKNELEHTINLLQQEVELVNNKLQQCLATATAVETRLLQSMTDFERKLDNEEKERKKDHNDVLVIIGEMKQRPPHPHHGHGDCPHRRGRHRHDRR